MEQFNRDGSIPDDMLPEMEKSLLDALNNQDLSSGYSPIYPNRILTDVKELIVWIGVNFSIYPKVETPESLFGDLFSKRIRLISFNDYKRYDLVWEYDIENFTKHHKDKINISIIEDYKKILPLITNFKKELRQKTGHLPYLGERNVNGDCFLLDKKIYRPDYDRIKADPTISLKNCICILLGIDDFSFISKIYGDLEFIAEEQERYSWKDDFVILPETEANEPFTKTVATMKYREGWQDIISYTKDFISKINRELEEGNLKRVDHNALSGHHNFSFLDINQETHKCDFETLPFLKWAKESEYEIPDELAFNENDDDTLQLAGSHTDHINESDKTYTFPGKQIASWEDLEIVLISKESVEINTNGHSTKFSYHELGMAHKNNPDNRKEVWYTLIRFAIGDGKISSSNSSSANPKKDKDRIKEFKNWCKSYFNLNENIYKHHYKTLQSWETKFKIRSLFEIPPQQEDEPTSPFDSELQETIRKSNLSESELYQD